jgi:hypothetical protein
MRLPIDVSAADKLREPAKLGRRHGQLPGPTDWICVTILLIVTSWIFGARSHLLGFYADDAGFLSAFQDVSFSNLLHGLQGYVSGRNLHILWQYLAFCLTGTTLESLSALHWLQAGMTALNVILLYTALRFALLPTLPSFLAAALFAFYPNHAEVHFWLSSMPMNLVSTSLVLLLVICSIAITKAVRNGSTRLATLLLCANLLIAVAAMFTYDQVVPVVMATAFAVGLICFVIARQLRLAACLYLTVHLLVFAILVVWRAVDPRGGPVFSYIIADHLISNAKSSFSLMFGSAIQSELLLHAGPGERRTAFAVAAVIFATALILSLASNNFDPAVTDKRLAEAFPRLRPSVLAKSFPVSLLFGTAVFSLLAYLPAYLWYLSPRHNYLPSIGLAGAAGVAIFISNSVVWTMVGKHIAKVGAALIAALVSCGIYIFVQAALVEKNLWIASYQARKKMYAELMLDPNFRNSSTLVLNGFPSTTPFGTAPLGYQQAGEVSLFTRGAVKIEHLVQNSLPSYRGDFVYTEVDQWGKSAFLYIPKRRIYNVRYQGLRDRQIFYSKSDGEIPIPDFYSISSATFGPNDHPDNVVARMTGATRGVLDLWIPTVHRQFDEVVALVPLVQTGGAIEPMTLTSTRSPRQLALIELPLELEPKPQRFLITFKSSVQPRAVQLFIVGETGRRLINESIVAQDH